MADFEPDYLVVGAGASAMALVDELVTHGDGEILMIDRRHAPGGHWVDAYPFVRLHQPSVYYGVSSEPLGHDRIDTHGINAGFYERASAAELCDYYERVMARFLASGRVRFFGCTSYEGADGDTHRLRSELTGQEHTARPRRRFVDATYVQSIVPAVHTPGFAVDADARLVTPNDLVRLGGEAPRFTLIGAGKTSMDTGVWLLDQGVDPDAIRWIRPRDGWIVDRQYTQPLELVASMAAYQAASIEACATVETGFELARAMEEREMMHRIDPRHDAEVIRGATIARAELDALRTIEQVVRLGRVKRLGSRVASLEGGDLDVLPSEVFVDCTAQGLATSPLQPIFSPGRITVQFTTLGVAPWSAANLGFVETLDIDDDERNRLCPPVPRTGLIADQLTVFGIGFGAEGGRRPHPEIAAWAAASRLNPGRSMADHMDDPAVQQSMAKMGEFLGPALINLAKQTGLGSD